MEKIMDTKKTDVTPINRTATIMYSIVSFILLIAYIMELVSGAKTMTVFIILAVTDIVPVVICWIMYKNNSESMLLRYVMPIGYCVFYSVALFTSTNQLTFVYAVPMMLILAIFSDFKFSVAASSVLFVEVLVHSVWYYNLAGKTHTALASIEIEIAVMLLVGVFTVINNKLSVGLNTEKINKINDESEKTRKVFENVMAISNDMIEGVAQVAEKMQLLAASSEETLTAMQEVQTGTGDSAESVQNQLIKTEEIQHQIDKVTKASLTIGQNVDVTDEAIREGSGNIEKLIKQVEKSEDAGTMVAKEVEELKASTAQMQSIVELIRSVASQTSLLALNASIEAARAGEAGRGFAVVATEISNLAGQTQSATGNISDLIDGISKEMVEVVEAINSLIDSNKLQNESASVTAGSFRKIMDSAAAIRDDSHELSLVVTKLADANKEIVESIQTISAITEEVSAHSNTTCETSEQNSKIVSDVQNLVEGLNSDAEKLKAMS